MAAGATWTSRTLTAGWAARYAHTSVVDAAGAIYVIGGVFGGTHFQDVWASTDGGVWPDSVRGGTTGYYRGYCRGTQGYSRVLKVYNRGTTGVLGVLRGYSGGS